MRNNLHEHTDQTKEKEVTYQRNDIVIGVEALIVGEMRLSNQDHVYVISHFTRIEKIKDYCHCHEGLAEKAQENNKGHSPLTQDADKGPFPTDLVST